MKLITITGPSGAGKDTVAQMLSDLGGYKVICSYTTRPKREGEIDGWQHYFVEKCDVPHDKMLAYTQYGGYEYWTTIDQVTDKAIYVIDEDGLKALCEKFPGMGSNPTAPRGVAGTLRPRPTAQSSVLVLLRCSNLQQRLARKFVRQGEATSIV